MQPVSKGLMRFADVAFGSLRVGPSTILVHYNTWILPGGLSGDVLGWSRTLLK